MSLTNQKGARRKAQEILGLDFGSSGVKAVRMRLADGGLQLLSANLFPSAEIGAAAVRPPLDKPLLTNYAAIAVTGMSSVIRVIAHVPSAVGSSLNQQLREQIGLDSSYRVAFANTGQQSRTRGEQRMLAVALGEKDAAEVLDLFREGAPAPSSLELSGLAAVNASMMSRKVHDPDSPACHLDCGARVSTMAFVNKGAVILTRKLDVGGEAIIERVQRSLGLDRATAESIMAEGAIDISQAVGEVIDPFLRQMNISRDFVERQENCRVTTAWITGGMSMSRYWLDMIGKASGMTIQAWDSLEGIQVQAGAVPDHLVGQMARMTGAIGAARAALEGAT